MYDLLGQAFAGAEVGTEQTLVRLQNSDQGHAGKVMTLGQHLGAEQNAGIAAARLFQQIFQLAFAAGAVAVDADVRDIREVPIERTPHPLGAGEDRAQIGAAALVGSLAGLAVGVLVTPVLGAALQGLLPVESGFIIAPAPLALLRGRYRYRFLVNAKRSANLQAVLRDWIGGVNFAPGVRVGVDVDPYSFV